MERTRVNYRCSCGWLTKSANIIMKESGTYLQCTECLFPFPYFGKDFEECQMCKGRGCVELLPFEDTVPLFMCGKCQGCVPLIAWNMLARPEAEDDDCDDDSGIQGASCTDSSLLQYSSSFGAVDTGTIFQVQFKCSCGNDIQSHVKEKIVERVAYLKCPCCAYPQPMPQEKGFWCPTCNLVGQCPKSEVKQHDVVVFECHYCHRLVPKDELDKFNGHINEVITSCTQPTSACSHTDFTYRIIAAQPFAICKTCFTLAEIDYGQFQDIADQLYICDCEIPLKNLTKMEKKAGHILLRCPNCDYEENVVNNDLYRALCDGRPYEDLRPDAEKKSLTSVDDSGEQKSGESWINKAGDFASKHADDIGKLVMGFIPHARKYTAGEITGTQMATNMISDGLKIGMSIAKALGLPPVVLSVLQIGTFFIQEPKSIEEGKTDDDKKGPKSG